MQKYRKVIVALVGAFVLIASEEFGAGHLIGMEDQLVNGIITMLTAFGVWRVPNAPPRNIPKETAKIVLDELRKDVIPKLDESLSGYSD